MSESSRYLKRLRHRCLAWQSLLWSKSPNSAKETPPSPSLEMPPSRKIRAANGNEGSEENGAAPGEEQKPSKRRKRTKYTPQQVELLKASFAQDPYPGIQERQRLENILGVREDRLSVWFQNRRARHPKSVAVNEEKEEKTKKTEKRVLQSCRSPVPSTAGAPAPRVAGQPRWHGNRGAPQPGQPLGVYHPGCLNQWPQCQQLPQGAGSQYESNPFGTRQATSCLPSAPSIQNLPFGFGGAEDCTQLQQQQSQQNEASWNSYTDYNSYPDQDPLWQEASPAQHQNAVNANRLTGALNFLQGDFGCAQSSSSGGSPVLYGGEGQTKMEHSPMSTYNSSHSSPSYTAQWPGPCQWGTQPTQYSPSSTCQGY